VCVCSLNEPPSKEHAPYDNVVCGLSTCTIFSTLSHKGTIFGEKLRNKKKVFDKCVLAYTNSKIQRNFPLLLLSSRVLKGRWPLSLIKVLLDTIGTCSSIFVLPIQHPWPRYHASL